MLEGAYTGSKFIPSSGAPIETVTLAENGGGLLTWLVDLNYPGCSNVTLEPDARRVTLDFGGPIS